MKVTMVMSGALLLLVTVPVPAGPINLHRVSGEADWVAHADYDAFNDTTLGKLIRAELNELGIEDKLRDFSTVFSFHPIDDVRSITVYGQGKDRERAVALIEGTFDQEKLLALVRMNEHYEQLSHGDLTIHRWVQDEQKAGEAVEQVMYGFIYGPDLVVISAGQEAVMHAADVLESRGASAAGTALGQRASAATGAVIQVVANAVDRMADSEDAAALRQADALSLTLGESQGNVYIDLDLTAKSAEAAETIQKIVDGLIAFVTLNSEKQPRLAALVAKVQSARLQKVVQIRFRADSREVFELMKEQWDQKRQQQGPGR